MLIVPIREGEPIERALKKFKKKFERTGVLRQVREGQCFLKPSVLRRNMRQRAIFIQKIRDSEEN